MLQVSSPSGRPFYAVVNKADETGIFSRCCCAAYVFVVCFDCAVVVVNAVLNAALSCCLCVSICIGPLVCVRVCVFYKSFCFVSPFFGAQFSFFSRRFKFTRQIALLTSSLLLLLLLQFAFHVLLLA